MFNGFHRCASIRWIPRKEDILIIRVGTNNYVQVVSNGKLLPYSSFATRLQRRKIFAILQLDCAIGIIYEG